MSRDRRLASILSILSEGAVSSQEVLIDRLAALGIETTQATLSRDLRALGVVKTPAGYVHPTAFAAGRGQVGGDLTKGLERALQRHLISVTPGVGMVVCKTGPGQAQVVALEFDRHPPAGVIGTVGGDDTIFVATATQDHVQSLTDDLLAMAELALPQEATA